MASRTAIIRISKKYISHNHYYTQQHYWQHSAYYTATRIWRRTHKTHSRHNEHDHADLATTVEISGPKGVQITMIGLAANVGLTVTKAASGWVMNSAALLADAAHSLSDLLGDFVTLYTYKMSRRPPDKHYPYGYGKYETIGSLAMSSLLIAGAVGIGAHSLELFQHAIDHLWVPVTTTAATTTATTAAAATTSATTSVAFTGIPSMDHDATDVALNPNAAWFAAGSVVIKEWLYRKTLEVGRSERSEVLVANAWHHRSDAMSSGVVMFAIVGSYVGVPILDPLGGLVVAGMVLKSSLEMTVSSLRELADRSIDAEDLGKIKQTISFMKMTEPSLIDFSSLRGRKLGPFYHIDMVLKVNPQLSVQEARQLEQRVRSAVQRDCAHVQQILFRLEA